MVGCPRHVSVGLDAWSIKFRFLVRDAWEDFPTRETHPSLDQGWADGPDALVIGWERSTREKWNPRASWRAEHSGAAAIYLLPPDSSTRLRLSLLEQLADDCLVLPVFLPELLARVRLAVKRRRENADSPTPTTAQTPQARILALGHLWVDLGRAQAFWHDTPVPVSPREADLLALLVEHDGSCVSRRQVQLRLMKNGTRQSVAGRQSSPDIDSAISVLRGKLARAGCEGCLQVVACQGFRLSRAAVGAPLQDFADTMSR